MVQLNTFGYVLIYFTILFTRCRLGIVTSEMMSVPKWRFPIIGFLEALGVATGMGAAAMLPGPVIPILNQTFLVWQLLFAVFGVTCDGVTFISANAECNSSAVDLVQIISRIGFLWPAIMVASAAFQAGASIIKEFVFKDAAKRLELVKLQVKKR